MLYHRNSLSASNALSVGGTPSLNLSSDGDMIPSDTGKLRFLLQRMCREMCVEDAAVFLLVNLYPDIHLKYCFRKTSVVFMITNLSYGIT